MTLTELLRAKARAVDVKLADEMVEELEEATEGLKAALGPNPDPWQSASWYR